MERNEKNYFETKNKKDCNGCGVCVLRCPYNAIDMKEDDEGFLYPVIDEKKCVKCGLCKKVCPNSVKQSVEKKTKSYIAVNKNNIEKYNSSSGGIFFPIAKNIINKQGVVFGVKYNENLVAIHDYTDSVEGLKDFQGSKYVRSDLNNSYKKVEEFLMKDKYVLFTGTPCQCQGLRGYLKKEYSKLYTCEIVCHANPSPKVFSKYILNLEKIKGVKVKDISFRTKENGWKNQAPIISYQDGSKEEEKTYLNAFVSELINRPSCYDCRFCREERYSDFTIADFWGIEKIDSKYKNDDTGISLFCINTDKGKLFLKEIEEKIFLKEVETKQAFSYNHHENVMIHPNRKRFFKMLSKGKINEENIINYMKKYIKRSLFQKVNTKMKLGMQVLNEKLKYILKND